MPLQPAPGHCETPGMGTPRLWPPSLIDTPGALIHRVKLTCRGAEAFRVGSQDRVPGLLQEAVRRQGAVEVAHAIAPDGAVIIEHPAVEIEALGVQPVEPFAGRDLPGAPH